MKLNDTSEKQKIVNSIRKGLCLQLCYVPQAEILTVDQRQTLSPNSICSFISFLLKKTTFPNKVEPENPRRKNMQHFSESCDPEHLCLCSDTAFVPAALFELSWHRRFWTWTTNSDHKDRGRQAAVPKEDITEFTCVCVCVCALCWLNSRW